MAKLAARAGMGGPPPGFPVMPPGMPPGMMPGMPPGMMPGMGQMARPPPAAVTGPPPQAPAAAATRFVKLENMFDPATETDEGWDEDIKDDTEEECGKYGRVLHCHVDKASMVRL